jgi:hypothetical protein
MAKITAAKDIGDTKGDKRRRATASALVQRASDLATAVDLSGYPEVKAAVDSVASLSDTLASLDVLSAKLKNAPAGLIAVTSQKELDEVRTNLDAMLAPMVSTMSAVEKLLETAAETEVLLSRLQQQAKDTSDKLAREKARLAGAASALANARKIG